MPNLTSLFNRSKKNSTNTKKKDKKLGSLCFGRECDVSKRNVFIVHHGEKSPTRSPHMRFFRRNHNKKSSDNLLESRSPSYISSTSFSSYESHLHSHSDTHTPSGLPKCNTKLDYDTVQPAVVGPQKYSSKSTFFTSSEYDSSLRISLQNSVTSLALSSCSNKLSRTFSRCQSDPTILQSNSHRINHLGRSDSGENLVLCRLCLCDYQPLEMIELKNCSCRFCKYCLPQYIMYQILDGNVTISCPDGQCEQRGEISPDEVESFVDTETFDRYQRFLLNLEVDLDPNLTWCPRAGCETICALVPGESTDPSSICCPTCGYTFCSVCKARWHDNISCEDNARILKEGLILSNDVRAPIKRCPKCRIPIEFDGGCPLITCRRCKHAFCWYCLTSLDYDLLMRHFDNGPCKHNLGLSRAGLFWLRTVVVCILAGIGLVLLVTLPVLLFIVPCIVCCAFSMRYIKRRKSRSEDGTSEPTYSSSSL